MPQRKITFCFMPTHIHLALKQQKEEGISLFMGKSSYWKFSSYKEF